MYVYYMYVVMYYYMLFHTSSDQVSQFGQWQLFTLQWARIVQEELNKQLPGNIILFIKHAVFVEFVVILYPFSKI